MSHSLTEEMILELSGVDALKDVQILVLRSLGLRDVQILSNVSNLVSLSLSHNELRTIDVLPGALPYLDEINVNSNKLSTLSWLAMCPALKRLFASSNEFVDLAPIASLCPQLKCACLHGNLLPDLDVTLSFLTKLDLDEAELDGNPCTQAASYRSAVIVALPKLRRLDCETVTDEERTRAAAMRSPSAPGTGAGEAMGIFWTHSDIPNPSGTAQMTGISARSLRRPTTSHQHT